MGVFEVSPERDSISGSTRRRGHTAGTRPFRPAHYARKHLTNERRRARLSDAPRLVARDLPHDAVVLDSGQADGHS